MFELIDKILERFIDLVRINTPARK